MSYSSSGIKIENLSPLRVGLGSCDSGISQTFERTYAKDFWVKGCGLWVKGCGFGIVFGAILEGTSSSRHFQGIVKGLEE